MPTYILLALIFAIGRALVTIYQKYIAEYVEHDWKLFVFFFYFSGLIMAIIFYLINPWPFHWQIIWKVFPSAFFFFGGGVTLYYSLFKADVSIIGGLQPLKLIPVTIFANLILGESFSFLIYFFMGLMIIGSFLVVIDEKIELADFFNWPIAVYVISVILFAFSDVFAKKTFDLISPISFMSVNLFLCGLFSLVIVPFALKELPKITFSQIKATVFNSITTFGVVVLLVIAFQKSVTISNAISNLTGPFVLLFTIILARLKPHFLEQHTAKIYRIRFIGALISYLAAVGIIVLV